MKRYLILMLAVACWLEGFACFSFAGNRSGELLVFAGAGMRLPLVEIGDRFYQRSDIKIVYDFEGSGRLGNKILVGQKPDVFIPGSEKWANILREKGHILDFTPIAYHTPLIITPPGNDKVASLADFTNQSNRIVLGDKKAAAIGRVSDKIFQKAGLDASAIHVKARGLTVKQLVAWVEGNNADASIVWQADANQSGKVRTIAIPENWNVIARIPVCRLDGSGPEASTFVDYLTGPESKAIFSKHGFRTVE
jgi:molybdate transport system substrate-binding protein